MKDGGPASTRMGTIEAVLFDVDGVLQPMSPGYVDLARAWAVTGQKRLK